MKDQYGDVTVQREGHVATVAFARPPSNFVNLSLLRDLTAALFDLDGEREIRAIVLASGGKVFCAGANLAADPTVGTGRQGERDPFYLEAARLFQVKKPIVAAVQGAAIGAGLGLTLVADFRVASPEARFAANFVKLGFHPGFGITATLERVVGKQRALLMCLTGRRLKAEEALAWGLVDELVPAEQLHDAAKALAAEIAEAAPLAVQATRATMRGELFDIVTRQTDHELVQQTELRKTADFAEGVRAVNERRPGKFIGA
ncbi:MAG: enoyl-CoA hydratase/isomerase family protein [Alphaproteobacteria bacterium]|nr:enoyl-CoA hydratase/isomerase family protein [Alphaproteobacteria bacterium]